MWFYWLMMFATLPPILAHRPGRNVARSPFGLDGPWAAAVILLVMVMGFRLEVGGDWFTYIGHFSIAQQQTFAEVLAWKDPGYQALNWLSARMEWNIYGTNVMSALIFSVGLAVFCRNCKDPWLAFLVAIPYLVIVVGMGYTRQGVALGLVMIALVYLERANTVRFAFFVILAALFHKSAVIMLPIAALTSTRRRLFSAIWILLITVLAYRLFVEASVDDLYYGYLEKQYESQGAFIRLLMNAVPAAVLLLNYRRFSSVLGSAKLWMWMGLISMALLAVLFVSPSSTAVDRIGLYMIPLQLVVFSSVPTVLPRTFGTRRGWTMAVIGYSMAVQFVWLNFASHAKSWIPYRSYLFDTWM